MPIFFLFSLLCITIYLMFCYINKHFQTKATSRRARDEMKIKKIRQRWKSKYIFKWYWTAFSSTQSKLLFSWCWIFERRWWIIVIGLNFCYWWLLERKWKLSLVKYIEKFRTNSFYSSFSSNNLEIKP